MGRQTHGANGAQFEVGEFVQDGCAEAQIVEISPDGAAVTIEYTDTREQTWLQHTRIVRRNGELRVE